ncbi:DUF2683 family protein [Candidatus Pacearchaeota archaeon]|nr:DUF2683 family protein [Candidatus Pacearchaeota archaeon]
MESQESISARIELTPQANRIINVVKAKYNFKDKSEAINKFLEIHGHDLINEEAREDYVKEVLEVINKHMKSHKSRKMTLEQLDSLCEV